MDGSGLGVYSGISFPAPPVGDVPLNAGLSAFRREGPSEKYLDLRRPFQFYGRGAFFVVVRHVILLSAIGMASSVSVVHRAPRASANAGKPSHPRLALLRTSAPRSRWCRSLSGSVNGPETDPYTYTILLTSNESRTRAARSNERKCGGLSRKAV